VSWLQIRKPDFMSTGALLALLIVASAPNFGLKYALSAPVPSALLAFMGMWLMWKERTALFAVPAQRRWAIIALLLLVPILISVPASYNVRYSASVAVAMMLYYFTGLALIRVLRDDSQRAWLARWILVVLVFWLADGFIQSVFGKDLFGIGKTPDGRIIGPFDGNLRLSLFLAMLLPVAMVALLAKPRGWMWAIAFFIAASTVAIFGGARGVLVMLLVATAGTFLHLPQTRWNYLALLIVLVAGSMSVVLSPVLRDRLIGQIERVQHLDFETLDAISSQRLTIWHTAGNMLRARPLNGVGAGAFEKAYKDHSTLEYDMFRDSQVRVHHAHQVYVSFAAETGLPGLLALIAGVVLCIRWYWKSAVMRRAQAWSFALALSVYFFPFNTQPPLFNHWLFPILLLLLAAFLASLDDPADAPAAQPDPGKITPQRV